jgi:hypothetical protein
MFFFPPFGKKLSRCFWHVIDERSDKSQQKLCQLWTNPRTTAEPVRASAVRELDHGQDPHPVRLAYQPPANSTFLSEQISTSRQPPAKRTGCGFGI